MGSRGGTGRARPCRWISVRRNSRARSPDLGARAAVASPVLLSRSLWDTSPWGPRPLGLLPSALRPVQPMAGTDCRLEGRSGTSLGCLSPHAHWATVWQWLGRTGRVSHWSQEPQCVATRSAWRWWQGLGPHPWPWRSGRCVQEEKPRIVGSLSQGKPAPALWHPRPSSGSFQHPRNTILSAPSVSWVFPLPRERP